MADLLAYKGALVGIWLAGLFLAERFWPAAPLPAAVARAPLARLARNLALAAINFLLSPLVILPLTALAAGHALAWRPVWWQGWPGLALDLVLLDFLIYWWHRANHRWHLLWRFHLVHHLDRILDSTSALRFHFGEVLISAAARAGAILLLGFPFLSIVAFETLLLIATIFHHSNLRLPPRLEAALASLVITPSIHWVHHHRRHRYGFQLRHGVQLLGPPVRQPEPGRRSPEMEIGVEGAEELALPGLLLRPVKG